MKKFNNTILIIIIISSLLVTFAGTIVAQEPTVPDLARNDTGFTIYTIDEFLSANPEAMGLLNESGLTKDAIFQHRNNTLPSGNFSISPLSSSGVTENFPISCPYPEWGNTIYQTGTGGSIAVMKYSDNSTGSGLAFACPDNACIIHVWARKPNVSTSKWTVTSSTYAHHIHSWCSNP